MVKIHRQKVFSRNHSLFFEKISRIIERKHLSCGILVQDRCSKSTAFSTRFDQETLNGENTSSKSAQFLRKHFFAKNSYAERLSEQFSNALIYFPARRLR